MNRSLNTIAVSALILSLNLPLAAVAAGSEAEIAIRERIAALEKAWAKGDAEFVATKVYARDAVIQGEGQKETIHTAEGVKKIINQLVSDSKSVKLDIYAINTLGPSSANSWVTWHVTPKASSEKPFDVRALFVWTKGKQGWRIRADMYSLGGM